VVFKENSITSFNWYLLNSRYTTLITMQVVGLVGQAVNEDYAENEVGEFAGIVKPLAFLY
jgi:hypothetical protein